jgi:hypothetical protein
MQKKTLLLIFSFLISLNVSTFSQEINQNVIATDGGFAENNKYSITYTIGEVIAEYQRDTTLNVDLTQGFNQSYISFVSVQDHLIDVDIDVYPNPAVNFLNVSINSIYDELTLDIFDISGKLITHKNIQEKNFKVGFSSLAAGTYLMVFSNSQQNLKTIKVQKSL